MAITALTLSSPPPPPHLLFNSTALDIALRGQHRTCSDIARLAPDASEVPQAEVPHGTTWRRQVRFSTPTSTPLRSG